MRVSAPPSRKLEGFEADIETKKSTRALCAGAFLYKTCISDQKRGKKSESGTGVSRQTGIYTFISSCSKTSA